MPRLTPYEGPTFEPVLLTEVKSYLRIASNDFAQDTTELFSIRPDNYAPVASFGLVGSAVSVLGFQGRVLVQFAVGIITSGGEVTVRIRESSDSVFWTSVHTFTPVNDLTDDQIYEYEYLGTAPYLRAEATVADGSVVFSVTVLKDAASSPDDALLNSMIVQAREMTQNYTRRTWCQMSYDLYLDGDPGRFVELPMGPVQSITSVTAYSTANVAQNISSSAYFLDNSGLVPRLIWNDAFSMPSNVRSFANLRIRYVAGYSSRLTIPEPIKLAVKQAIAHFYENRQGQELPSGVRVLLDPFRAIRVF